MIVVSTLFVVLLSSLHIFMIGAPRIHVPRTDPSIMIDGALSKGEWQHAARVDIPGTGRVYVQRSAEFVYIAVEYTRAPSGIVDLFVSPANGQIYDFHASAKLGERQLVGNQFPEWIWWNNDDWTANVSRVDSFEERTFLPTPIREFQIRRSRFASAIWRVRFALTAMGSNNETLSETVFPENTSEKSTDGWLELSLKE